MIRRLFTFRNAALVLYGALVIISLYVFVSQGWHWLWDAFALAFFSFWLGWWAAKRQ